VIAQSLDLNEVQIWMVRSTPKIWRNLFLADGSHFLDHPPTI
jgi:hypothetical protein